MNLTVEIHDRDSYTESLATAVLSQHKLQAFASAHEASRWLNEYAGNPRLRFETNSSATRVVITMHLTKQLTLHCN
jgi:hypothetical protein